MALETLEFTKDWTDPDDFPTYEASEAQVRADQQYLYNEIRNFLNQMIRTLNEHGAAHLGVENGDNKGNTTSIQAALELLRDREVAAGNVPIGGEAGQMLQKKSGTVYDLEWRSAFVSVPFTKNDWKQVEEDGQPGAGYEMVIPFTQHKRRDGAYICRVRHTVDGVLTDNTWATLGTQSAYDSETLDITLRTADAYDGAALFYST